MAYDRVQIRQWTDFGVAVHLILGLGPRFDLFRYGAKMSTNQGSHLSSQNISFWGRNVFLYVDRMHIHVGAV